MPRVNLHISSESRDRGSGSPSAFSVLVGQALDKRTVVTGASLANFRGQIDAGRQTSDDAKVFMAYGKRDFLFNDPFQTAISVRVRPNLRESHVEVDTEASLSALYDAVSSNLCPSLEDLERRTVPGHMIGIGSKDITVSVKLPPKSVKVKHKDPLNSTVELELDDDMRGCYPYRVWIRVKAVCRNKTTVFGKARCSKKGYRLIVDLDQVPSSNIVRVDCLEPETFDDACYIINACSELAMERLNHHIRNVYTQKMEYVRRMTICERKPWDSLLASPLSDGCRDAMRKLYGQEYPAPVALRATKLLDTNSEGVVAGMFRVHGDSDAPFYLTIEVCEQVSSWFGHGSNLREMDEFVYRPWANMKRDEVSVGRVRTDLDMEEHKRWGVDLVSGNATLECPEGDVFVWTNCRVLEKYLGLSGVDRMVSREGKIVFETNRNSRSNERTIWLDIIELAPVVESYTIGKGGGVVNHTFPMTLNESTGKVVPVPDPRYDKTEASACSINNLSVRLRNSDGSRLETVGEIEFMLALEVDKLK